jgi:hypothetical protein
MAAVLVSPRTAHLLATYAPKRGRPCRPAVDEMLTIEPPPARTIDGVTVFMPRNTPCTLTRSTRSKSSSVVLSSAWKCRMPALLTSTVTGPNAASAASTAACHWASSVTSRWT